MEGSTVIKPTGVLSSLLRIVEYDALPLLRTERGPASNLTVVAPSEIRGRDWHSVIGIISREFGVTGRHVSPRGCNRPVVSGAGLTRNDRERKVTCGERGDSNAGAIGAA